MNDFRPNRETAHTLTPANQKLSQTFNEWMKMNNNRALHIAQTHFVLSSHFFQFLLSCISICIQSIRFVRSSCPYSSLTKLNHNNKLLDSLKQQTYTRHSLTLCFKQATAKAKTILWWHSMCDRQMYKMFCGTKQIKIRRYHRYIDCDAIV